MPATLPPIRCRRQAALNRDSLLEKTSSLSFPLSGQRIKTAFPPDSVPGK